MSLSNRSLIGRGWAFPLRPRNGALSWTEGEEKIKQSIMIILTTAPGERVMLPAFGCGLNELMFQPNTVQWQGAIQDRVRDALVNWEPRIDVIDVRVESPAEAKHIALIHIDYRVRSNNAFYNLVYPFYLNEGPR